MNKKVLKKVFSTLSDYKALLKSFYRSDATLEFLIYRSLPLCHHFSTHLHTVVLVKLNTLW
ncbi:hypothetical protein FKN08_13265 [Vibrio sp. 1-2 (7-a)]|nr:hypothetical protein [Vibrio sp. 1-2 (7-a)]